MSELPKEVAPPLLHREGQHLPPEDAVSRRAVFYAGLDWLLCINPIPELGLHRHPATAIGLGVDGPLQVRCSGQRDWETTAAVLVPAEAPGPAIRAAAGRVAFLFLPVDSAAHRMLLQRNGGHVDPQALSLGDVESLRALIRELADTPLSAAAAATRLRAELDALYPDPAPGLDPRVGQVIVQVLTEPGNSSLAELAASTALSQTRLLHLFKQSTGLTLRRFRMWARTLRAAPLYQADASFTDIALDGGFTDSSHLSRNFKALFGATPSAVMREFDGLEVISDQCCSLSDSIRRTAAS